ncbi:MAG: flagellar biosynthesis anti-sigma factor FlgM [Treponema sp.]|nr:flagellar biosynthesis anti-sigma factor FlgM [Treponema sp.]MBQ7881164.1 flagellar biosynthesis anti-sigma factor FlgM [Treponema sp.]
MMIDKISGVNPLNNVQNTRRIAEPSKYVSTPDSINVSDEAKEAARAYYLNQVAEETPEVRANLVAEIKEKIKDPNYLSSAVISSAADNILDSFGL